MPGLVGLITKKPRAWAEEQLALMLNAVRHESFYATGTLADEGLGVYVGWTALKNSFADGMPLRNERGDVVMVFSGEDYAQPRTSCGLRQKGHSLECGGPAYLAHLYEEEKDFPRSLNGMFHGVVMDRSRGAVTLFNDRYGMHRVFYHQAKDAFYFAAEAKAIVAARPELRTPNPKSVGEFVSCSCVLEDRTIFQDVHGLPGASSWTFRNAALEQKTTYFEPREWEQQTTLGAEEYFQEVRAALQRNLPLYFGGREQVGMTITGGLDTRVIMTHHQPAPGSIPCYTFGGMYRDCEDVRLGRKLAKMYGQPHQVIEVGKQFLSDFPRYAQRSIYLTEGGVDVYRASDLYVSERARQIAPVKVVGTYGSEIVRQAVMFKPMEPAAGLYAPEFLHAVHEAKNTYNALRRQHPVTFAAFRQSPWYHHGILALEQSQLTVRSPFLDNDFVRAIYRAPERYGPHGDDIRLELIRAGSPALAAVRSDRGVGGNSGNMVSNLVRNYLEFTFKAEYAYDYGMPQPVARVDHMLSGLHLERLFLGRHKLLHFRVWYRDALAKYVQGMLLDPRTLSRPYLQRDRLETVVRSHVRGERNYTTEIHKMLTLELLQRQFFDAAAN